MHTMPLRVVPEMEHTRVKALPMFPQISMVAAAHLPMEVGVATITTMAVVAEQTFLREETVEGILVPVHPVVQAILRVQVEEH
jgi:hypothetical protein